MEGMFSTVQVATGEIGRGAQDRDMRCDLHTTHLVTCTLDYRCNAEILCLLAADTLVYLRMQTDI
eukprot:755738-Hanusia_phi.AAC.5